MKPIRTRAGRILAAVGETDTLTSKRLEAIAEHMDADARIASVSLVAAPSAQHEGLFLRATAPAGVATVIGIELADLVGACAVESATRTDLAEWMRAASERGLWHDWLLVSGMDVARATPLWEPADLDTREQSDISGSHHAVLIESLPPASTFSVTVDASWLGPHETGAQVLVTAAIAALGDDDRISRITMTGIENMPSYAAHLHSHPKVVVARELPEQADIVWYPNQIDRRSNIGAARRLGRRVIATYLDFIAYDIPRYHASNQDWAAYRSMQRTVALSVDGITTISSDVARRLLHEVPRLDPDRVRAIPLGLDHIASLQRTDLPGSDIEELTRALGSKPFLLVLGNDFAHKNRDFAISVWERVLESGVTCDLVLAGLHVRSSSNRNREQSLAARHTNLRGTLHTVGHVSSQSRIWLLSHASVVIYPSSAEGFGFVPYEAATLETPSTFTAFGPLAEISGSTSVPRAWSIEAYVADVIRLLTNAPAREGRITELRRACERYTWRVFADELVAFMVSVRSMPTVDTAAISIVDDAPARGVVLTGRASGLAGRLRGLRRRFTP